VSSVTQRIWLTKLFGWALRITTGLIIVLAVVNLVTEFPGTTPDTVVPIIQGAAIYLIIAAVVAWLSDHLFKLARAQEQTLDQSLLGYVVASDSVSLDVLAGWTRTTQSEVARLLAKLASAGKLKDYQIDLPNRMVTKVRAVPASVAAKPSHTPQTQLSCPNCKAPVRPGMEYCEMCGTRLSSAPTIRGTASEVDEAIRVKAKIYELEVLRQQGKISGNAYDKLKEEYEKKLAQADKGTQVY
jgi:hypothetical protein